MKLTTQYQVISRFDSIENTMLPWETYLFFMLYHILSYYVICSISVLYVVMITTYLTSFNSLRPGDSYVRHWTGSSLLQVMACRLFGAQPLPEVMLSYCQLDPKEQTSMKFKSKKEIHLNLSSAKSSLGLNVSNFFLGGTLTLQDIFPVAPNLRQFLNMFGDLPYLLGVVMQSADTPGVSSNNSYQYVTLYFN